MAVPWKWNDSDAVPPHLQTVDKRKEEEKEDGKLADHSCRPTLVFNSSAPSYEPCPSMKAAAAAAPIQSIPADRNKT